MRNFNILKNFDVLKKLKYLFIISFFLSFGVSIKSFLTFSENIETLGTPKEWKFYASLAGFIIFSSMFFLLVFSWTLNILMHKFKDKLNNMS